MFRNLVLISLTAFLLISGCAQPPLTPEEEGLKTRAEIEAYCAIPKNPDLDNTYVSHFAKSNFSKDNSVVIGAISSINYDLPNSQRGTIEVFQILWGSRIQKSVNVYSSEVGFLEACKGEQVFVLRTFAGGNNAKIVTNFQLDPQIYDSQIKTLKDLFKLEKIENFLLRKQEFMKKCFEKITDENAWVANTWSFQFFHFCKDYPENINFEHLARLKQIETEYVRNRPYASDVLKVIKATLIVMLKQKFKRVWFEAILNKSEGEARKAIELLDFWVSSSYASAFSFEDRIVVNSLMRYVDKPMILDLLLRLERNLKDITTNYDY